jgi:hypothetical protein
MDFKKMENYLKQERCILRYDSYTTGGTAILLLQVQIAFLQKITISHAKGVPIMQILIDFLNQICYPHRKKHWVIRLII